MILFLFVSAFYQVSRSLLFLLGSKKFHSQFSNIRKLVVPDGEAPFVSVLVPAFNEETVITGTLNSLIHLDYPNYEIIVLDDGSSDKTVFVAQEFAKKHSNKNIRVHSKANSGKAATLNVGLEIALGEYVLCIDADTRISKGTLIFGINRMISNPQLAALAGIVDLDSTEDFLTKQQELEYNVGNLQKATLGLFGKTNVVPGPIGLFRKSVVLDMGGYTCGVGSYAEDTEITLRIIAEGYQVSFEPQMIAHTQAPRDWFNLMKQRYRWVRGTYQAVFKHIPRLINSEKRSDRAFGLFLYCEQVFPVTMELGVLIYFLTKFLVYEEIAFLTIYLALLILVDFIVARVCLEKISLPRWRCFNRVLICRFSYSINLLMWKVFSIFEEWKSVKMGWDKVYRYSAEAIGLGGEKGELHG